MRTTLFSNNHTNKKNQTSTNILKIYSSHISTTKHLYDLLMLPVLLLMSTCYISAPSPKTYTDVHFCLFNNPCTYMIVPTTTCVHTRLFPLQLVYMYEKLNFLFMCIFSHFPHFIQRPQGIYPRCISLLTTISILPSKSVYSFMMAP